ncbi:MAG TPA: G8 domain-containing protein [Ktedonobacteraceae bacterium]|nr:G8 domain-containing protein [Ktedonobacteraceae bacterium]
MQDWGKFKTFFHLQGHSRATFAALSVLIIVGASALAIPHIFSSSPAPSKISAASGATPTVPLPRLLNWSNPVTWQGHPPTAGAQVVIPANRSILLDTSPPPLTSLTIEGTLVCAEKDLSLSADWILIPSGGLLLCGSELQPFQHHFVITLTGNNPQAENVAGMGTKLLGVVGGRLELHGQSKVSWVHLAQTAPAGTSQIVLDQPVNWTKGDRIAIASTTYDPLQAEEVTVKAVSGTVVTLSQPLKYTHWGQLQTFAGQTVDERAEVGLLSHNIVVQGDSSSVNNGFGGQSMFMSGSIVHIADVEFYHMGQFKSLARYPVHWHLARNEAGDYIENSSIDHSFNRCITIHGTDNVLVRDNVAFDTIGHCYFLEDGSETGNLLEYNLGIETLAAPDGENLLPSDTQPATFWITNPDNYLIGNVSAGSEGEGFWFALPEHPLALDSNLTTIWPRQTPLGLFIDDVAHSDEDTGLLVDNGPNPDNTTTDEYYQPVKSPGNDSSAQVTVTFQNFTAYKESNLGVWMRGYNLDLTGAILADNSDGAAFAGNNGMLENSLLVGQTANDSTTAPLNPGQPLVGYSFYDGPFGVKNDTFVNFQSNSQRPAAAVDYFENDRNPIHIMNFVQQIHLVNANGVYLMQPTANGGDFSAFLDADGSLTGQAGQFVIANNSVLVDSSCTFRAAWNAYVCRHHFVNVSLDAGGVNLPSVTIARDDGVTWKSVVNDSYFSASALPDHTYTWSYTAPATTLQIDLTDAQSTDWVELIIPYSSANCHLYRDAEQDMSITAASSLDEFNASHGQQYFYDKTSGLLYIKLVPQNGNNWARVNVVPG